MDRQFSNSTISTTNSLSCSISSKNMLLNIGHSFKANRNSKYRVKGVASSRWRPEDRRNCSLRSNTSLSSNLGRGFEGMRLGNLNSGNADFKDAPFEEIYFNYHIDQPIFIKSAELNRALHRDIKSKMVNNNSDKPVSFSQKGEERWSAKSCGETALFKPTRRGSHVNLCQL
jgi:hypothetical protein